VSVESLPTPARPHVLKALHSALGLACVSPCDRAHSNPFSALLHRLKSLSRLPASQHALLTDPWLLKVPQDPEEAQLHRDLARELSDRLLPGGRAATRHIMVCLDCCPHEAFENLVESDQAGIDRDVTIQSLLADRALITKTAAQEVAVFDSRVVRVRCPAYAADNAVDLEDLCRRIVWEVRPLLGQAEV
jgi:hypothetical protein